MLDQSLKIAVDPFFGASENQYQMNQEFVATEIKYSMVYEETIKNIRGTPFWDDNYLTQSPYLEKMKQDIQDDQNDSPTKVSDEPGAGKTGAGLDGNELLKAVISDDTNKIADVGESNTNPTNTAV